MNNDKVIEKWAKDSNPSGRGHNASKTLFYEGPVLYSYGYHAPIANKVGLFALVSRRTYSPTTGRHISKAGMQFCKGDVLIVDQVLPKSKGDHAENLMGFEQARQEACAKIRNARKEDVKTMWAMQCRDIEAQARTYCDLFDLPLPEWMPGL